MCRNLEGLQRVDLQFVGNPLCQLGPNPGNGGKQMLGWRFGFKPLEQGEAAPLQVLLNRRANGRADPGNTAQTIDPLCNKNLPQRLPRFRNSACSPPIRGNAKGVRLLDLEQLRNLLEHFGYLEVVGPRHDYSPSNALPAILLCIRCAKVRAWSSEIDRRSTGFRARAVAQR